MDGALARHGDGSQTTPGSPLTQKYPEIGRNFGIADDPTETGNGRTRRFWHDDFTIYMKTFIATRIERAASQLE